MAERIELRRATLADADALGAVHVASWRETYPGMVPKAMLTALSVEARSAMWRRIIDGGSATVLAAFDGDDLVGFGASCPQRDAGLFASGFPGEVSAIYILRSHQRQGIARSIMKSLAQELSGGFSLWVLRDNRGARDFYERMGGELLAEKTEERPDGLLVEVAYGWRGPAA